MKSKLFVLFFCSALFSSSTFAALQCTDFQCDVKWKTNMGEIDFSSVCYNFKGKKEYRECRKLAVDVFKQRCDRGKKNKNQIWVDIYCPARSKYRP